MVNELQPYSTLKVHPYVMGTTFVATLVANNRLLPLNFTLFSGVFLAFLVDFSVFFYKFSNP
jgi:hypothetical protein